MNNGEFVYFELNNWFAGRDYPNAEPFITWCEDDKEHGFSNEQFVRENELCVVCSIVDMSFNWCITAKREWVENNCPKLLSDDLTTVVMERHYKGIVTYKNETYPYSQYLRYPDENGDVYGQFGHKFLPWSRENIGITIGNEIDV